MRETVVSVMMISAVEPTEKSLPKKVLKKDIHVTTGFTVHYNDHVPADKN